MRYQPLMQIANDTAVFIHYTLKSDSGEVLDSSQGDEPLAYIHGHGNIVPGLERALSGKSPGDTFEVKVSAEDGYGARRKTACKPCRAPRSTRAPRSNPACASRPRDPRAR